ncbi:MAG: RNA 2',3'-cyclic phosphodiesterase [Candidatus Pacearchaeota archaeon]
MRAFVCIEISEEAKKEIINIINELKNSGVIVAKYVEPQNLHLTLKFFGEINKEEIESIKKKLDTIQVKKFEVELGKLSYFTEEFVRVLWVGIESNELKVLNEEFEKLFGKEKREFNGHITFARVKNIKDKKKFKEFFLRLKIKPIKFFADKIFLKKSELTPKGPIYSNIYVKELK